MTEKAERETNALFVADLHGLMEDVVHAGRMIKECEHQLK